MADIRTIRKITVNFADRDLRVGLQSSNTKYQKVYTAGMSDEQKKRLHRESDGQIMKGWDENDKQSDDLGFFVHREPDNYNRTSFRIGKSDEHIYNTPEMAEKGEGFALQMYKGWPQKADTFGGYNVSDLTEFIIFATYFDDANGVPEVEILPFNYRDIDWIDKGKMGAINFKDSKYYSGVLVMYNEKNPSSSNLNCVIFGKTKVKLHEDMYYGPMPAICGGGSSRKKEHIPKGDEVTKIYDQIVLNEKRHKELLELPAPDPKKTADLIEKTKKELTILWTEKVEPTKSSPKRKAENKSTPPSTPTKKRKLEDSPTDAIKQSPKKDSPKAASEKGMCTKALDKLDAFLSNLL